MPLAGFLAENYQNRKANFFKLEEKKISQVGNHISPTSLQTMELEIGSLKQKTLINEGGRSRPVNCNHIPVIDCKTGETSEKVPDTRKSGQIV